MKRYIILTLSLVFLVWFVSFPRVEISFKRRCPLVPTETALSKNEVLVFLEKFKMYKSKGFDTKVPENFAYDDTSVLNRLPWIVKKWFEKNCIEPARFYYVEQRLRTILKAYQLKKHTNGVIAILSSQMNTNMTAEQKAWYKNMITEQEKISSVENISDAELEIAKTYETQIKNLFNDKE